MPILITRQHLGIGFVVLGTALLAFAVKVNRGHRDKDTARMLENLRKKFAGLIEPTEARIIRWRLWLGLFFVALGSSLQW